jgi:hypothetical protein
MLYYSKTYLGFCDRKEEENSFYVCQTGSDPPCDEEILRDLLYTNIDITLIVLCPTSTVLSF